MSDVETGSGFVRFLLRTEAAGPRVVSEDDGTVRILLDGFLDEIDASGETILPSLTFWVALPPAGSFTISAETRDRVDLPSADGEGHPLPLARLPEQAIESGNVSWMRAQRVVPIVWRPILRGSSGATLEREVAVTVRFDDPADRGGPALGADRFEPVYRAVVVNYEQARGWRGHAIPRAARARTDYFSTTSAPWIVLSVDRTGLQAVTGTDLQAAGIDLASIVPEQLRLFTGTGIELPETVPYTELPSWMNEAAISIEGGDDGAFDPQDRILFYGLGPDGWFAEYGLPDRKHERYHTDENSNVNFYWLSWGEFEGEPMRWTILDGTSLPATVEEAALARQHFEQDIEHDLRPSEFLTGRSPFADSFPKWEKWFWKELIASTSNLKTTVPFHVPSPLADAPARMLLRFWGATPSLNDLNHKVAVYLGEDSLGAREWGDVSHTDLVIDGVTLSAEDLDLRLLAPYRAKLDRSYLAWFQIEYRRRLEAAQDEVSFLVEPGAATRGFRVSGLTDPSDAVVVDATDPLRPERITPAIEAGSGSVAFAVHPEANRERRLLVVATERANAPAVRVDLPPREGTSGSATMRSMRSFSRTRSSSMRRGSSRSSAPRERPRRGIRSGSK